MVLEEREGVVKVLPVPKMLWVPSVAYQTQVQPGAAVAERVTVPDPQDEFEVTVGADGAVEEFTL